jgi:hypothetical protein
MPKSSRGFKANEEDQPELLAHYEADWGEDDDQAALNAARLAAAVLNAR